ncbi:BTAD domain-containing putative transcriptional regulator [Actinomadura sp. 21ATH]|uniref:BTAD domain-containing putative transcriptional regulator n=1 Tax=Actinomadura sp. 21ATH TaxID=1735444 RepID=UPI0035BF3F6F
MRVHILGPLEAVAGGRAIGIAGARQRALLARLALDAGRPVPAGTLVRDLWDGDGPGDPANALHTHVSRLRRSLPAGLVERAGGGYRLALPPEAVDAAEFERLALAGRRALRAGDPAGAAAGLREALRLWRGEALADAGGAPFTEPHRRRLDELRLSAVEDRLEADLAVPGGPPDLVAEMAELVAAHPLRERPRELLIRALHAGGRTAEALAAYDAYRTLLAEELGGDPGPALRDLHVAILRGTAPGPPREGGLPAPLTSFVGRAAERERARAALAGGRLVTLVGPGGAGKTRLATVVAADHADRAPGGVWLAELAAVADPADVPRAVVAALGPLGRAALEAPGPRDVVARLAGALSGGRTLLVLDNCEHVIDAAARLAEELLGRCPLLTILATGREALGIGGETLCPVGPLEPPEAARLFAERAAAVRPGFAVTGDDAGDVEAICRRLDGLPLALELAAARLRSIPLRALSAGLEDGLPMLRGGRTALPRHRTLDAVVAWSWDLLDERERLLARRLAVFPAGITPEAAARVCGLAPARALDALSVLADKSLLQQVEGDEPRYRMLETIREYGLARLDESGERGEAEAAYTACFLDLAERARPRLAGAGQLPWLDVLAREHGNLMAALRLAAGRGDAGTAVRLAASLGHFWTIQGDHVQAAERLLLALRVPGPAEPHAAAAAAAFYAVNAILSGTAEPGAARAVQDRLGAADEPAAALARAGLALLTGAGEAAVLEGIARWLPHPDPWTAGMLLLMRTMMQSDRSGAADLRAAADAFAAAGERWGLAMALTFLSYDQTALGDLGGAAASLERAVALLDELGTTDDATLQRVMLATVRAQRGDPDGARDLLAGLLAPGTVWTAVRRRIMARLGLGDLARWRDDPDEAAHHYRAARADLASLPERMPPFDGLLRASAAWLPLRAGDLETARRDLAAALDLAVEVPDMAAAALAAVGAAGLLAARGEHAAAAGTLGAAAALRGGPSPADLDVAAVTREVTAVLGESAFAAAHRRGAGLERAAALASVAARLRPPAAP